MSSSFSQPVVAQSLLNVCAKFRRAQLYKGIEHRWVIWI